MTDHPPTLGDLLVPHAETVREQLRHLGPQRGAVGECALDALVARLDKAEAERDRLREALTLTLSRIGHQTWCACDICQPAREALGSGV